MNNLKRPRGVPKGLLCPSYSQFFMDSQEIKTLSGQSSKAGKAPTLNAGPVLSIQCSRALTGMIPGNGQSPIILRHYQRVSTL